MNKPHMKQCSDGTKEWCLHGKLHREGGAAIEWVNGSKEWYVHGKLHREDAPAIEYANGTKQWYLHGELHREDGAAIEYADGTKSWYLHDASYANAEAWARQVLQLCKQPCDDADVDAYLRLVLSKYAEESL